MTDYREDFDAPSASPAQSAAQAPILLLIGLIIGGGLLGSLFIMALGWWQGIPITSLLKSLTDHNTVAQRHWVRTLLLINHLTMFIIPALLYGWIVARRQWRHFYALHTLPSALLIGAGVLFLLAGMPLVQYAYMLNKALPLHEMLRTMESDTTEAIKYLLQMDNVGEYLFNMFLIGIIPAIGEELVFRGGIQQWLQGKLNNPHVAIWVAAIIFSAFHMQFEGFLPRMLLGGLLGYLFYWSGSLWLPMAAHLFNNGMQVLLQFLFINDISAINIEDDVAVPWWSAVLSGIALVVIGAWIRRVAAKEKSYPSA